MAIASIGARGSGVSGASGTTVTQTPGATVAVGRQLLVFVGYSNATDLACAVTDNVSATNVYEELASFGSGSARLRVYRCDVKVQISAASVITATFPSAIVDKAIAAWEYSVGAGSYLAEATAETTVAVNPAANGFGSVAHSGLASASRLYLRCSVKIVSSIATITASTNFTSWALAIRSRNNAAAVVPRAEFRINTSTGETSNPTFAVSGVSASAFLALVEASLPVAGTLTANLEAPTLNAAGAALVKADASSTLGAPTLSATGAALVEADASATIDPPTLTAEAAIANPGTSATLTATIEPPTVSASAAAPVGGDLTTSIGAPTLSATGVAPVEADASPALFAPTLSSTGAALVEGDLASTIVAPTATADAGALVEASLAATIDAPSLVADADLSVEADAISTLDAPTLDASAGTPVVGAELVATIDPPSIEAFASAPVAAELVADLYAPTLSADASVPVAAGLTVALAAAMLVAAGGEPLPSAPAGANASSSSIRIIDGQKSAVILAPDEGRS